MFMDIGHENPALFLLRKCIRLVHPCTTMGRSVAVVCDGFDVFIHIRIKMLPTLTVVDATRYHMPKVGNDTGSHQKLAFGIVIDPPRIAKTMGYHFKLVLDGVVSPNSSVDIYAIFFQ